MKTFNQLKEELNKLNKKSAYQTGHDAWTHHLTKDPKNRPSNPYKPGEGMGDWEKGAEDAYDQYLNQKDRNRKMKAS